ncbi:MAG: glycoside hydrolase family 2 TIM barrel-domain containing protein [Candidatus Choladocola sp.]|nr:glycoside hydrolase family 2 TIM barrel-domain containing protein [Candidatus Choladocola sp.]
MRLGDAFSAMRAGRKNPVREAAGDNPDSAENHGGRTEKGCGLSTVWSEEKSPEAVLAEYPRPQFRRRQWICLNGWWKYAFTQNKVRPETFDGQIRVPYSPECRKSGVGRRLEPGAYLWYCRTVTLEEVCEGKRLLLHFGAVDERCAVWWNGKLLGTHRNGYLAFSFDVTEYVRAGENTLWVCVQDDTDRGCECRGKQSLEPGGMFYTAQSGIWQTVWMEWVPQNGIRDLKITPLLDERSVRFDVTVGAPGKVRFRILGRNRASEQPEEDLPVAETWENLSGNTGTVILNVPDVHPWSPEDPFLYDLEITAGEDTVRSYFAMRKFSVGEDGQGYPRLLLNNRPYFFNGVLDQGYWPESLYTPPDEEAMIADIVNMKALGFNMLRKHIKTEPMRWYYHCDRLGMVVWQDMVNGGGKLKMSLLCYLPTVVPAVTGRIRDSWRWFFSRRDSGGRKRWEKDCIAMVKQLYNCPCIGMWVPFNEGWGQFDALRITEKIRETDDTRPVDHASGWFDQGGGDVKSVHNYFRPLKVKKEARPFVLSEYGGYSCPIPGHLYSEKSYGYRAYRSREELTEAFWELQKEIRALEKKGLSASVYTQVSDVEEEINGLYTYDRKVCKIACDSFRPVVK